MRQLTQISIIALFALIITHITSVPTKASVVGDVKRIITEEALETDVPTSLAMAIAKNSSGFRPDLQGENGAIGVMQILPETAESMSLDPSRLWNPRQNVRLGLRILSNLLERTSGNWKATIRAFNTQRFPMNSIRVDRAIAETLYWERRFAEQLALKDPVQRRRQDIIANNYTSSVDNEEFQEGKPHFSQNQESPRNTIRPRQGVGQKEKYFGSRQKLNREYTNLNRWTKYRRLKGINPETRFSRVIIIENQSNHDEDDDIEIISITDLIDEVDALEISLPSYLIWERKNRVAQFLQSDNSYRSWLQKMQMH